MSGAAPALPRWLPFAALALVGWLARGAFDRPDPGARARYEALATRAYAQGQAEARRHLSDSLALVHNATLETVIVASRHRSAVDSSAAARLTDTVRVLLPDTSARALFDSLGALHARELAEKDVQIKAEHDRAELFRVRFLMADSAANRATALLHQAVQQLDVATRHGHRARFVYGFIAGAAAVYAATR